MTRLMCIVFMAALLALVLFFILTGPALAADACPTWRAERDVRAARTAVRKAEARLAEAKRVLGATRAYSSQYGPSVGRWTRLSRRVGWPWAQLPTPMSTTYRESRGDPRASNGGVYLGLLQVWREHVADPARLYEPAYNLRTGLRLWRGSGWSPWAP